MKDDNKVTQQTLRLKKADREFLNKLKRHVKSTTEHGAVIHAIREFPKTEMALWIEQAENAKLTRELTKLKIAIANTFLAKNTLIDLTLEDFPS